MNNKIIDNFLDNTYEKLKLDFEKKALIQEMYSPLINGKKDTLEQLESNVNDLKQTNDSLMRDLNNICNENTNLINSISTLDKIFTQNIYK